MRSSTRSAFETKAGWTFLMNRERIKSKGVYGGVEPRDGGGGGFGGFGGGGGAAACYALFCSDSKIMDTKQAH
jgi:hypothetical protein